MRILSTRILAEGDVGLVDRPFNITGIAKHLDLIVYSPDLIIRNTSLSQIKTVYINMKWSKLTVGHFIRKILPQLISPVNIVLAGCDQTVPNNTDSRATLRDNHPHISNLGNHKYVNKLFIENLDSEVNNAEPIPLGIHPRIGSEDFNMYRGHVNIDVNKPMKVTNFNVQRYDSIQWAERAYVQQLSNTRWSNVSICPTAKLTYDEYLHELSRYMFTVCVHGGGLDVNPKLWESLLVGTIPIIRVNRPYTDIYKELDLPVVIVEDWSSRSITPRKLVNWRKKYYPYFTVTNNRKNMLDKLSLDYWIDRVQEL